MKGDKPKRMRPGAAGTASEALRTSRTVDLQERTDGHNNPPANADKSSGRCTIKPVTEAESVLAEIPITNAVARISTVQKNGVIVVHVRRWYDADGTMVGTRTGFTITDPKSMRTLAEGLFEAAKITEQQSKP